MPLVRGSGDRSTSKSEAMMFEGFSSETIETGDTGIFIRRAGSGAPLLLLHGFPETHVMWRDVAPDLFDSKH